MYRGRTTNAEFAEPASSCIVSSRFSRCFSAVARRPSTNLPEYTWSSWTFPPYTSSGWLSASSFFTTESFLARATRAWSSISLISFAESELERESPRRIRAASCAS